MDNNINNQNGLNNISPIEPVVQPLFVDVSNTNTPVFGQTVSSAENVITEQVAPVSTLSTEMIEETLVDETPTINVVEGVRSAYSEPHKPEKPTDPIEIQKE